jgi:hypothetical protein
MRMRRPQPIVQPIAFWVIFFYLFPALRLVQADAWERCGGRETLCCELSPAGADQTAESKFASCGRADGLSKR